MYPNQPYLGVLQQVSLVSYIKLGANGLFYTKVKDKKSYIYNKPKGVVMGKYHFYRY